MEIDPAIGVSQVFLRFRLEHLVRNLQPFLRCDGVDDQTHRIHFFQLSGIVVTGGTSARLLNAVMIFTFHRGVPGHLFSSSSLSC